MKIRQMIFPSMVFISFVLFGHWTGEQIENIAHTSEQKKAVSEELAAVTKFNLYASDEGSYAPMLPTNTLTYSPPGVPEPIQQKNLLIIGVDDLTKLSPKLQGIWLVLYLTDMPQVTIMPIFPAVQEVNSQLLFISDDHLLESFNLMADGSPHPDFLKTLDERNLWWTNFAVLDQTAVKTLLSFSKDSSQGSLSEITRNSIANDSAGLPDPEQQPEASMMAQVQTMQSLCHSRNFDLTTKRVAKIIADLKAHMTTDISPEQVIQDLKSMLSYGGGFICEFPFLSLASKTN